MSFTGKWARYTKRRDVGLDNMDNILKAFLLKKYEKWNDF